MPQELRLYSFINFYLSAIQQGVQTGHLAVDMVRKYTKPDSKILPKLKPEFQAKENAKSDMVAEWADNFKTFIILNGGDNESLCNTTEFIQTCDYPWVIFCEDNESLGGLQTGVAMVLPENIFNAKKVRSENFDCKYYYEFLEKTESGDIIKQHVYTDGTKDFQLIDLLKSSRLA